MRLFFTFILNESIYQMNIKDILFTLSILFFLTSCSKTVNYTPEFMEETSGRYLFNQDEIIDVYYDDNTLYLKWKGAEKLKPVIIDENIFFVADMYAKLNFVQHPETKKRYLSIISKENENLISYDYLKVSDSFKTPRMHLKDKEFDKALVGYLEIKKQDSTSVLVDESELNGMGYEFLRKKENEKAIDVFKMNVALYPESNNVYDSLGDAYLRTGDSLQAFNNYNMALELSNDNEKAKKYVDAYNAKYH